MIRFFSILCACILVLSISLPSMQGDSLLGDANADQRVDILDLQMMITKMLEDPGSGADVVDFQNVLNQAGKHVPPTSVPSPKPANNGSIFSYQISPLLAIVALHAAKPLLPEPDSGSGFHRPPRVVLPLDTSRYLFRLTENAPPVGA